MRMQKCVGCEQVKPHTARNFHRCKTGKHGLRIKCKICVRADVMANRDLKIEYYTAVLARKRQDPEWVARGRAYRAAWRKTPKGRASTNESQRLRYRFKKLVQPGIVCLPI